MTISEEIQPLSDRPARHCAVCGARVSDAAVTCLICGADLTHQAEETETPKPEKRKYPIVRYAVLVFIAIFVLTGAVIIGFRLNQQVGTTELPTFTPTPSPTPTITPSPTLVPTSTATPVLPTQTPQPPEEYFIQEGDTLSGIAAEYGLSVEDLLIFNNLTATDILVVGQKLNIPLSPPTPGPSPTLRPGEPTATSSPYVLHTVRAGDSLSTISDEYNVAISIIKSANNIPEDSDAIQLGQVLTIPMHTPTPEPLPVVVTSPTPTPGVMTYVAPLMLYPPNKAQIVGFDSPVILQWSSIGILNEREFYNAEIIISTETEKTTYNVYLRATAWRIPQDWLSSEDVSELSCTWRVHVVRQVTESVEENYKIISTTVARRSFSWIQE